ncbi:uncharacterized protein BJ212DRAFT_214497 [Suillus subaureus]|uniref:F-box domain-containing protein n=1 Tax=Suillus subaureus TaxID=48587 RepID=A0A9P7JDL9_9AGAM|nr:uncharacterized protein BJ212DRAFT_214497 [Suillus subaureus]KAG1816163.1 hypothetical protein BJ212DRAFT_214497 [Suillus subaureus]
MHSALTNLEIIHTISSFTQRRSLPALASTCREFEHPALNALWRDLQSVEPLVKCLPSDLFSIDQGRVVLQRPVDGKMWDTLFKYMSRVHSITVTQKRCSTVVEPLSVLMLSCPSTSAHLFPNLSKLTWHAEGTYIFAQFLRMALVPSMLVLHVEIFSASTAFLSVLSSLGTLCPHLQNMTMRIRCETNDLSHQISPFITQPIAQLHHLHTLSVWDLGSQGIKHVMKLRALQSLDLNLRASLAWDRNLCWQLPGFHGLKWLGLSTRTIEHASNFFSSLQVVGSSQVRVSFTSQVAKSSASASTMLFQFFTILRERCDIVELQYLSLVGCSGSGRAESGIFTPLHAFPNLTHLLIDEVCNISMSDEDLCQLVRAWPKLQVLKFSSYVAFNATTVPTFHGLIKLLRLCPVLTSLSLVIDTTKMDGIDLKRPGGGLCNKHLKFLALGNSHIKSPLNVALILSGLFPLLGQVDLAWWDMMKLMSSSYQKEPMMEQWVLVNSFLSGFSVVRERGIEA